MDQTHLQCYFGVLILAGVFRSKGESTESLRIQAGDCPCGMVPTLPHPGERRQEGKRLYPGFLRTLFFQMPGQPCARHMLCRKGELQKARLSKSSNSQTLRAGRPIREQVPHGNRRRSGWQRVGGTSPADLVTAVGPCRLQERLWVCMPPGGWHY